ncbi:MAG: hypothetical protein CMQ75_04860 [Gammaproteobacteria bacterium]|nr:hypothetical protein [Gammaproteobacteria bacterium]|tara:strand:- start:2080 stop:3540 length:1461 start_codon:yes stop_codon:yes gene_type:complete
MGNFVGIDLGTTFSVLSVYQDDGKHEIIYDKERFLPSVVYFAEDGSIDVGNVARQAAQIDPDNVVTQIKKKMPQNNTFTLDFNETSYSPEDISCFILKKLIKDAEKKLGRIDMATITVPAFYNDIAREATKNAAIKAGISVPTIISEPVAAALYYSRTKSMKGKVLIYDLGGGTLDCSVVQIDGDQVEVIGTKGDSFGGTDFDNKLYDLVNKEYMAKKGSAFSSVENGRTIHQEFMEGRKISLDENDTPLVMQGEAGAQPMTILKSDLESAVQEYILKSEIIIETLLDELNLNKNDIDEVVLVGGSTRMPLFYDHLKNLMNKENLVTTLNVDEVVSLGASIYCAIANKDEQSASQSEDLGDAKLIDVVNHYYGTRVFDINRNESKNSVIINKNDKYPITLTKEYFTPSDTTILECVVTQSEINTEDLKFCEIIAETELKNLTGERREGLPVYITFSIDENMILVCSYKDELSGKEVTLEKNLNIKS